MPAFAAPTLDGLVVGRPLDPDDPGAGWLARDLAAGRWLVLRGLPSGMTPDEAPDSWPTHPHLLAPRLLRDVRGVVWVAVPFVAGERLDRRARAVGGLTSAQVRSVALPLVNVLMTLHGAGRRAPGLAAGDVLLTASGRPMLDGWALLRPPGGSAPADDVRSLADLLGSTLVDDRGPLRTALTAASAHPPAAAQLHSTLAALGPADPLRPPHGAGGRPSRGAGSRSRHRRRHPGLVRPLGLVVLVVALAAGAGTAWARLADPGTARVLAATADTSAEAPAPSGTDWTAVLQAADAARAAAFASGDAEPLGRAVVPGSAAEERDLQALHGLRDAGVVARGWAPALRSVEVLAAGPATATLRVVDELPPWELVDGGGQPVHRFAARGPAGWTVQLAWSAEAGWRVAEVRPDPGVS